MGWMMGNLSLLDCLAALMATASKRLSLPAILSSLKITSVRLVFKGIISSTPNSVHFSMIYSNLPFLGGAQAKMILGFHPPSFCLTVCNTHLDRPIH